MGFLGDLKNKITGGAATVTLQVPSSLRRGAASTVKVQATAKANGKVAAVYLLVRGTESCEFKTNGETVRESHISFEHRVTIAGAQEIKAGEVYNWEGQVELPTSTNPSLSGKLIEHRWEIQAGLDMPGNDPDSGWQNVSVA